MIRKSVPFTSRCPNCQTAVHLKGNDFLTQPEVWARCPDCATEFNVPLIPGEVNRQPLVLDRPTPAPRPVPARIAARMADPLRPQPPMAPSRAVPPSGFAPLKPPATPGPTPSTKGAVPFAPLGSMQPTTPPPLPGRGVVALKPVATGGGKSAGRGFNALPAWAQYAILGLILVVVAAGIFLSPLGSSGSGGKDDREPPGASATP